ncbi:MAG: alpha/beta hydrolase [Hyphomicrobiaceae bacterium]|nr:alpha/beta hydrolase [Hyphomicrobiaceae bacterium]
MAIEIIRDIVYGEAEVGYAEGNGAMTRVALKLDAYLPAQRGPQPRPGLVLAFGGAFHRGSKESDSFSDGVGTSTAMAEYCRRLAGLGLACFSVAYRLAQSDPAPVETPVLTQREGVPLGRASVVREMLGLGPITPLAMARAMDAAFEDVATAARFVLANGERFGVDPARTVLGGFSAGGRCAMYAAYARGVPVAGVVSISGPMMAQDAAHYATAGGALPPLLYFSGQSDLEQVLSATPGMVQALQQAGADVTWARIPGATHFYPAEARTESGSTVLEEIVEALRRWQCLPGR